ncbi:MAG: hypothetical protein SFX73_15585 [Kofleriaceae bacterium]|nr:hypothetical protein [Kofleriaceae bacterium]
MMKRLVLPVAAAVVLTTASCSKDESPSGSTDAPAADGGSQDASAAARPLAILSAYLGIVDANALQAVRLSDVTGCPQVAGDDAMPVVVSIPIDTASLATDRITVRTVSGASRTPTCATLAPANEPDELRTLLIAGPLGSADDPPKEVVFSGDVLALDGRSYRGVVSPSITRVDAGVGLAYAIVDKAGPLCAGKGSSTEVQLAFQGGVTKNKDNANDEFDAAALPAFHLVDAAGADKTPLAFDDLDDGDNYLVLCVPAGHAPTRVTVDAKTVFDPTNNPNTSPLEASIEPRN